MDGPVVGALIGAGMTAIMNVIVVSYMIGGLKAEMRGLRDELHNHVNDRRAHMPPWSPPTGGDHTHDREGDSYA